MMTMMMTSLLLYDNPREIRQPHTVVREALDGGDCGKGVVTFKRYKESGFFFFSFVRSCVNNPRTERDRTGSKSRLNRAFRVFVCIYREHCNFSEIKTLERNGLQSQLGHEATDSISQHAYLIHKGVEKLV